MANNEKNMVTPPMDVLTQNNKYNRYALTIAVAKSARAATDEYVRQKTEAEGMIERHETDKHVFELIDPEYRDERAVRIGIDRLSSGAYSIDDSSLKDSKKD